MFGSAEKGRRRPRFAAVLVLALCLAACTPPTPSEPRNAAESRIAIRSGAAGAEFYDTVTGEAFVPRGHNFVKYTFTDDPLFGPAYRDMVLSPSRYDETEYRADLKAMRDMGFNVVRVFLENCSATDCIYELGETDRGLSDAYLDTVTAFLELAADEEMYVWLTSNTLPDHGYYLEKAYAGAAGLISASQAVFLSQEGLDAYSEYFTDLLDGLVDRDARLDRMFSFSIRNEYWYDLREAPWTESSGTVTTATGQTYDLAVASDREALADETLIHFVDTLVAVVKDVAPTALVSVGFFAPNEPHEWRPGDFKHVRTARVLAESNADFFDLHSHPGGHGLSFEQSEENFGSQGLVSKPVVMGELAMFRSYYPSVFVAAQAAVDWQAASCAAGYDGWLTWHWEGDVLEGDGLWGSDGTPLGEALAPALHPDPCATVTVPNPNLAYLRPVSASSSLPDEPAANAVDGTGAQWGSGGDAPQWIEVDLGSVVEVGRLRLTVAQFPEGDTVHEVYGGTSSPADTLLHTFSSETEEGDVLEHLLPVPTPIRYLRVVTTSSPSWVSWREVEVFARD